MKSLRILQHSLGLDEFGQGQAYRNHFVTSPGSADFKICQDLVAQGLMHTKGVHPLAGRGGWCFWVTEKGREFVAEQSPKPPKLSRSKLRYKRYLEFGDCFDSFIEFCHWDAEQARKAKAGGLHYGS